MLGFGERDDPSWRRRNAEMLQREQYAQEQEAGGGQQEIKDGGGDASPRGSSRQQDFDGGRGGGGADYGGREELLGRSRSAGRLRIRTPLSRPSRGGGAVVMRANAPMQVPGGVLSPLPLNTRRGGGGEGNTDLSRALVTLAQASALQSSTHAQHSSKVAFNSIPSLPCILHFPSPHQLLAK